MDEMRGKARREHAERNGHAPSANPQSTQKLAPPPGEAKHSQILLRIAEQGEFWHSPNDVAWVTIERSGHREHWPVRSSAFRQWLAQAFYKETKKPAGSYIIQDVVNLLEGRAKFEGSVYPVFVRVAGDAGSIFLDLADEAWQAVEITKNGWRVITIPPVRFRRPKAMLALPTPIRGGSVNELRRFVNVADEHWPLVLAFALAAFRPTGPHPLLKLLAEQGGRQNNACPRIALAR
jgi:hypothetical protein